MYLDEDAFLISFTTDAESGDEKIAAHATEFPSRDPSV